MTPPVLKLDVCRSLVETPSIWRWSGGEGRTRRVKKLDDLLVETGRTHNPSSSIVSNTCTTHAVHFPTEQQQYSCLLLLQLLRGHRWFSASTPFHRRDASTKAPRTLPRSVSKYVPTYSAATRSRTSHGCRVRCVLVVLLCSRLPP